MIEGQTQRAGGIVEELESIEGNGTRAILKSSFTLICFTTEEKTNLTLAIQPDNK